MLMIDVVSSKRYVTESLRVFNEAAFVSLDWSTICWILSSSSLTRVNSVLIPEVTDVALVWEDLLGLLGYEEGVFSFLLGIGGYPSWSLLGVLYPFLL